jgi:hypothetical protein
MADLFEPGVKYSPVGVIGTSVFTASLAVMSSVLFCIPDTLLSSFRAYVLVSVPAD